MSPAVNAAVLRHLHILAAAARSDRDLLNDFAERHDEAAFAAVMRRHGPLVLGVCRRLLGQEQDAEDAFQATFLVLARKAASIRWQETISSWLYQVAGHIALRARRAAARQRRREQSTRNRVVEPPPAEASLRELQALLDAEVARLPENYRAPFVLCCLERLTKPEAARKLGWKEGTVSSRLAQARERLRTRLVRRGVTLSATLTALAVGLEATAAVPLRLAEATRAAALAFRAGSTAVPAASAQAVSLAQEGLKVGTLKLKLAAVVLLAAGLTAGAAVGYRPSTVGPEPELGTENPTTESREPKADLYGDPLPAEAHVRLGTRRFRHDDVIKFLAFSPNGEWLISQGNNSVRVWDTATGKELRHFTPLRGQGLGTGSLSLDGKLLAVGGMNSEDRIGIWDTAVGRKVGEFGKGQYSLVTFSPDGRSLAAIASHRVELWEVATGRQLHAWDAHDKGVWTAAFTRAGKTLVTSGADKRVCFWDVATGMRIREIKDFPTVSSYYAPALQTVLAPDGSLLAAIRPGESDPSLPTNRIGIWDAVTGKQLRELTAPKREIIGGHWDGFRALAFTPQGKLVTAGPDSNVRIWDPTTGRELRRLPCGGATPFLLALSRNGKRLAVAPGGHAIRVIDLTKDQEADPSADLPAVGTWPSDAVLDGGLAVTAQGDPILWDAATGKPLRRLKAHRFYTEVVRLSADGRTLFSAGYDKTVRVWDTATGKELHRYDIDQAGVGTHWMALAPGDKPLLAVQRLSGTIDVLDALTGKTVQTFKGHHTNEQYTTTYLLAFTPAARTLVVCFEDRTVVEWDVATGKKLRQWSLPKDDLGPGPVGDGRPVFNAALSPDGRLLAYGSQSRYLVLIDMTTGKDIYRRDNLPDGVCPLAFSPDGKSLAWAGWHDPTVHLVEVLSGQERHTLRGHDGRVLGLSFSRDGKRLISASGDGTALIWDLTGKLAAGDRWGNRLSAKEIETAWADLAGEDAARAYQAIRHLSAAPAEPVAFLSRRLQPAAATDDKRIARLIGNLDSDEFTMREQAAKELQELGDLASEACRRALEGNPSLEVRRRLEGLLQKQARETSSPQRLRTLRAVEVLERAGTPEARQLLDTLARGAQGARLTQEAQAALERLGKR